MTNDMRMWLIAATTVAACATFPVLAQTAGTIVKPAASAVPVKPGIPGPVAAGCIIADGTPGAMSVKDPKAISATEISFIDSVAGPQRSLWNPPTVAPKFVPSRACMNGMPIDIRVMPAGVTCRMLTNNPAPSGGGAVKLVSCR